MALIHDPQVTDWTTLALVALPWVAALAALAVVVHLATGRRRLQRQRDQLRVHLAEARQALQARAAPLAGLLSREAFEERLDEAADAADRGGDAFSLLYLDLDGFRAVNDTFGHRQGDALLRDVARQLAGDAAGPVCRVAADEFAMLVPGPAAAARELAAALPGRLSRAPTDSGIGVSLSCSIGIARYPEHGGRSLLLANAALAMRSVKLAGGGDFADYDPQMGHDARDEMALLADLRRALERGQLSLYYQPKVDARSLQVTAAEALMRWHHPERGMVSPARFVPLAERHGLIGALGTWALEQACRQAGAWRGQGLRMRVAVNLSAHQLRQDDLVDRLVASLDAHGIPHGRFTVEITESVAMEDTRVTRDAFEKLREAGLHVSIDDFGTGFSSLASLRRLPAAELKIDRAFVCDLESSSDARAICEAIVHMAHTIGLRVVAEGVETPGQRDLLVAMGCDELQGYLFARPMSAQALGLWAADDGPDDAPEFRPSLFDPTQPIAL